METPLFAILGANLALIAGSMGLVWLLSLAIRDASIVDVFWGLGFVLVAWSSFALGEGRAPRQWLCVVLTTLWGMRLGAYLAWRNLGHGEDRRYVAMRRRHGDRFGLVSLYSVFGLQGVVMFVVSLPVQVVQAIPGPARLGAWDLAALALFGIGFAFECIGDWQLARFKAGPANTGRVMDRGLWAWTRHPNYFGDCLVWWGLYCIVLPTPVAWAIVSPMLMTVFLLRVSGVALLERRLVRHKPDYADYVARTSAFVPWPPRRG